MHDDYEAAYAATVRIKPDTLDPGVREVIALLNVIPGVATRGSCEGAEHRRVRRRHHGDLAYVSFRHPPPLDLQQFLLAHLDPGARIERDAIYSRWPTANRSFLDDLTTTVRLYLSHTASHPRRYVRRPLAKLRARVAHELSRPHAVQIDLCTTCADIGIAPHPPTHQVIRGLRLTAHQELIWFSAFATQPENALDPALIAADGWPRLLERARRGDFGASFYRRWLRHRARLTADLATLQLRVAAEQARRHGTDVDFYYDQTHAYFAQT